MCFCPVAICSSLLTLYSVSFFFPFFNSSKIYCQRICHSNFSVPTLFNGCESWTIKKAEHRRSDVFELWCWRRLLRVPWMQGDPTSRKSVLTIHWKQWCWSWNSNTLTTWWEELTYCKRPWCWEILKVGGEGDDRRWDGWMASPTQWTWVWVSFWSWWWTGKPGVLQSKGLQRVGHNWATELNWPYSKTLYLSRRHNKEIAPDDSNIHERDFMA